MKRITKRWIVAPAAILFFYVASYFWISADGHYAPIVYGIADGPGETVRKVPKGYIWHPLGKRQFGAPGKLTYLGWIYFPLWQIDRIYWHQDDGWIGMDYPISEYFDHDIQAYRDHRP